MSEVHEAYEALVKEGYSKKDAAKEAQKRTGIALRSGRRIKAKGEYDGKTRRNGIDAPLV